MTSKARLAAFLALVVPASLVGDALVLPEDRLENFTGTAVVEGRGDQIVVVMDGLQAGHQDGVVDELFLFRMDRPLPEPFRVEGLLAHIELFHDRLFIQFPVERVALDLSLGETVGQKTIRRRSQRLSPEIASGIEGEDHLLVGFKVHRLRNGVGLVHQSGDFGGLLLNASQPGESFDQLRPLWDDQQQEPNPGGPGGSCQSSCSINCGSNSCSASCASGRCARCNCTDSGGAICSCV